MAAMGIRTSRKRKDHAKGSCITAMHDHARPLISLDLLRTKLVRMVRFWKSPLRLALPVRHLNGVAFGSVQLRHGLHHAGCQVGIAKGGIAR
jgi:hypothetical protein